MNLGNLKFDFCVHTPTPKSLRQFSRSMSVHVHTQLHFCSTSIRCMIRNNTFLPLKYTLNVARSVLWLKKSWKTRRMLENETLRIFSVTYSTGSAPCRDQTVPQIHTGLKTPNLTASIWYKSENFANNIPHKPFQHPPHEKNWQNWSGF